MMRKRKHTATARKTHSRRDVSPFLFREVRGGDSLDKILHRAFFLVMTMKRLRSKNREISAL